MITEGRSVEPLTEATWEPYAGLIERHGGVFGGCWCMGFHAKGVLRSYDGNRENKQALVESGEAHAALVMEDGACIGWAQYGSPAELPRIKNRKEYEKAGDPLPDWRITCFFIDKGHRREGVAAAALEGACALIAKAGGGVVEGYPDEIEGQKTAAAFLWCGTLSMFERAGFTPVRKIGLHRWVVRRVIPKEI